MRRRRPAGRNPRSRGASPLPPRLLCASHTFISETQTAPRAPGQRPSSESLLPLDSMRDWEGGAPQTWRAGLDTAIDMRAQTRGEQAKSSFRANYPVDHRPSMHNYMQVVSMV